MEAGDDKGCEEACEYDGDVENCKGVIADVVWQQAGD
jgi:hypothetical protein